MHRNLFLPSRLANAVIILFVDVIVIVLFIIIIIIINTVPFPSQFSCFCISAILPILIHRRLWSAKSNRHVIERLSQFGRIVRRNLQERRDDAQRCLELAQISHVRHQRAIGECSRDNVSVSIDELFSLLDHGGVHRFSSLLNVLEKFFPLPLLLLVRLILSVNIFAGEDVVFSILDVFIVFNLRRLQQRMNHSQRVDENFVMPSSRER